MKALSLHQPWASLCVTERPCPVCDAPPSIRHLTTHSMVKRFETRSWPCPPNLIGSRIALHATVKAVGGTGVGDYMLVHHRGAHNRQGWRLLRRDGMLKPAPLGAVVGSAVIEACYPIVAGVGPWQYDCVSVMRDRRLSLAGRSNELRANISDQLPYGDYRPGRYAWLLGDAAPTTERCPWCDGTGFEYEQPPGSTCIGECPVCKGETRCDPIPARGRQRIWNWDPTKAAP